MKRQEGMTPERLKELREGMGWTRETLASWLGLAKNTVARMERGELPITVTTARLAVLIQEEKNQQKILSGT